MLERCSVWDHYVFLLSRFMICRAHEMHDPSCWMSASPTHSADRCLQLEGAFLSYQQMYVFHFQTQQKGNTPPQVCFEMRRGEDLNQMLTPLLCCLNWEFHWSIQASTDPCEDQTPIHRQVNTDTLLETLEVCLRIFCLWRTSEFTSDLQSSEQPFTRIPQAEKHCSRHKSSLSVRHLKFILRK